MAPQASGDLIVRIADIETPIGGMLAAATDTHLLLFEYPRRILEQQMRRVTNAMHCAFERGETPVFEQLRSEVDEYFRGERQRFEIPLHVPGTPFQTRVWDELQRIPIGTTTSYGQLAKTIGHPDAVRAVARANGDNRVAIIIPCHRVIGSDGSLTGYGGGLWRKQKLLDLEARTVALSLPGF